MVARFAVNEKVLGSNPSRGAIGYHLRMSASGAALVAYKKGYGKKLLKLRKNKLVRGVLIAYLLIVVAFAVVLMINGRF